MPRTLRGREQNVVERSTPCDLGSQLSPEWYGELTLGLLLRIEPPAQGRRGAPDLPKREVGRPRRGLPAAS